MNPFVRNLIQALKRYAYTTCRYPWNGPDFKIAVEGAIGKIEYHTTFYETTHLEYQEILRALPPGPIREVVIAQFSPIPT